MVRGGKKNERTQSIILACLLAFSLKCPGGQLPDTVNAGRQISHVSLIPFDPIIISSHQSHQALFLARSIARHVLSESQMGAGPFALSLTSSIAPDTWGQGREATRHPSPSYTLPPPLPPPHLQSTPSSFTHRSHRSSFSATTIKKKKIV